MRFNALNLIFEDGIGVGIRKGSSPQKLTFIYRRDKIFVAPNVLEEKCSKRFHENYINEICRNYFLIKSSTPPITCATRLQNCNLLELSCLIINNLKKNDPCKKIALIIRQLQSGKMRYFVGKLIKKTLQKRFLFIILPVTRKMYSILI
jgi:hypothetical protein